MLAAYSREKGSTLTRRLLAKIDSFYCLKKMHNRIPEGATWGHRMIAPTTFLAVGAIAPMESAPMEKGCNLPLPMHLTKSWIISQCCSVELRLLC